MHQPLPVVLAMTCLMFSACLSSSNISERGPSPGLGELPWPHPTGIEWPPGLVGPFSLGTILNHTLERPDGVSLFGSVLLPDVPEGTLVPTILEMGPYFDNEDQPTWSTTKVSVQEPSRPLDWVQHGYAVAYWSVRGTGRSTGCFEMGGPNEWKDSAAVVEWLAAQPWSNGRVGMMGLSYPGTTPIQAMSLNAKGLAAVAVMGTIADMQLFWMTPEHEPSLIGGAFGGAYAGRVSIRPSPVEAGLATRHPERLCPEVVEVMRGGGPMFASDEHDTDFWKNRRYRDHLPNATAAVFLQQGFDDAYNSGHIVQDRILFEVFQGPKRMFEGQWGHSTPPQPQIARAYPNETYTSLTMKWFDYWLKGLGTAEQAGVGLFEFQDNTNAWHRSAAWPPAEHSTLRLHLGAQGRLGVSEPGASPMRFEATPGTGPSDDGCLPTRQTGLSFTTQPASDDWLVAGNPTLELLVTSSGPSGSIAASLFRVNGDSEGACKSGTWTPFSWGAANLRFAHGGGTGRDFPTQTPTTVRITLSDFAEVIPKGSRLGLAIAGAEPFLRPPQAYPSITISPGPATVLTIQASEEGAPE
jgi:X-Pro dipeptidyl-peptidase